jgi:hypothetical protein
MPYDAVSHTTQHQTIKIMDDEFEKISTEITMAYMHVQAQYLNTGKPHDTAKQLVY